MINHSTERFQIVVSLRRWSGFRLVRYDKNVTKMAYIYDWILCLGFLQVRRWHKLVDGELPN